MSPTRWREKDTLDVPWTCHDWAMEEATRTTGTGPTASGHLAEGRSGQRALICSVLAQTPEQRLLGLRRAAEFFGAARRA